MSRSCTDIFYPCFLSSLRAILSPLNFLRHLTLSLGVMECRFASLNKAVMEGKAVVEYEGSVCVCER